MESKKNKKKIWKKPEVLRMSFKNTLTGGQGPANPETAFYTEGHS